jgi:hypothetical protein
MALRGAACRKHEAQAGGPEEMPGVCHDGISLYVHSGIKVACLGQSVTRAVPNAPFSGLWPKMMAFVQELSHKGFREHGAWKYSSDQQYSILFGYSPSMYVHNNR